MSIPKYYLKPFWQAERISRSKGCTPNTVMGIWEKSWNKMRLNNIKPIFTSQDPIYFIDDYKNLAVPIWALTKRLIMEEAKNGNN